MEINATTIAFDHNIEVCAMNLHKELRLACRIFNLAKNMYISSPGYGQIKTASPIPWQESCHHCSVNLVAIRHCSNSSGKDKDVRMVYYGTLTPQIRAVKIFSLLSSAAGLAAQPMIVEQSSNLGAPLTVAVLGAVGFFTFVTPILLHIITRKYVTHLYFIPEEDKYTAVTYNFFLRKREITFSVDEVEVPEVPGMFMSFRAKGVPLFVDPRLFEDRHHYARLMGYDKPIDFKLSAPEGKKA